MDSFLTIDEVVANAATIIKPADRAARNVFKQWAYIAESRIGPSKTQIRVKRDIKVIDLTILKPNDFVKGIDIGLFTEAGRQIEYKYRPGAKRVHFDYERNLNMRNTHRVDLSEDRVAYHLGSPADGVVFSASIRYYGLPLDDDGDPVFQENHLVAIMAFINYMWSMRENKNRLTVNDNRAVWKAERASAKSFDKTPDMLEGKEIAKTFNSMIQKIFHETF